MQYGVLFDDIDNNLPKSKKEPSKGKPEVTRNCWEESSKPILTTTTLFGEWEPCNPVVEEGGDEYLRQDKIRAIKTNVMARRYALRQPLHHPDDHKKDLHCYYFIRELAIEMQRQILIDKGMGHYASGVFYKNPHSKDEGFRVQVWDNEIGKKCHVAYAQTREDAEEELRQFWLKRRGVDIKDIARSEMPPYLMELLYEALESMEASK